MKKVLILFAHPALQKSRVNIHLIREVRDADGVTLHDLYQAYPEFDIDIRAEQALLTEHDIIIFHHPLFWYNTPALLKEWQDLVLEHNWAYGSKGNALRGKYFLNVITTGGPEHAYQPGGFNGLTLRQFLAPIEFTARLCKMVFLPPYVVHGTHAIESEAITSHATDYVKLLRLLQQEALAPEDLKTENYINHVVASQSTQE